MKPTEWRQRRPVVTLMGVFLTSLLLLWLLTPQKTFFAGLFLGGLVSLYNILNVARKLTALEAHAFGESHKRPGSGMINRFLMAAAPLLFAAAYPQWIDFRAVLLGLPSGLAAVLLIEFWDVRKKSHPTERGEK
ncbi:ATP synthase subunit I [Salinithrix halophila]|uniref:ATP synthase subunit I n=1 Tax=Salinithrix halophila TaxID=1485204 RepID=A0ABV8JFK8_9BACL